MEELTAKHYAFPFETKSANGASPSGTVREEVSG